MDIRHKLEWLKETEMAVVVSEEQDEIDRFKKWDLDIVPHRMLMKSGFITSDGRTLEIDLAFKKEDHPFPTMQIETKKYKVFGIVTNIKEMNGEDLIH